MQTKNSVQGWFKGAVFMLAATLLTACGGPSDSELVLAAKDYLAQARVRAATIELKNALQENPQNAEARYLLGEINLSLGDIASAEKEFRRAAEAGWPDGQARIGIARAMLVRNALQALLEETGVEDSYPASVRANLYALHALAQAGLNNLPQAEQLMDKAMKLDAGALYVLKSSVLIRFATGDEAAANESMARALEAYGDKPEIILLSALVASGKNDQAGAIAAYQKVIALEPPGLVTMYGRRARLALARQELLSNDFDQAEKTLAPLFRHASQDLEVNYLGGFLAFKQGQLDLAEKRLLLVLKTVPDYVQAQLLLGSVSYAQGNFEQAAYYIARYVSAVPGDLRARKLLGLAYNKLGQRENAQAVLEPALKNNTDDAELLALVGLLQLQAGDTASGIRGLEQAVAAAPDDLVLKNKLARAYIFSGETEHAVKALNSVLAKGGDKKQGQALLIAAHMKARQFARAINTVRDMLRDFPDDPDVLTLAGNVYQTSKNRIEARKYFNQALQINPGHLPANLFLARLEELEGRTDKARSMYEALVQANKKDINALLALARLAAAQNRPKAMVGWLQQAAERAPRDFISRKALIEYYLREKQLREAELVLKEAAAIAPEDRAVLDFTARLRIAEGRYNEALAPLNKLVTGSPDLIYARTLLAEVYFRLDQRADVRRQLEIVLGKQSDYVPALALMANLELRSGHFDRALEYAVRVQKVQPELYAGYELAGDALMNQKDYAAAIINYDQAWQRMQLAGLAIKRSEALARAGRLSEAAGPLLAWLEYHPEEPRVLQSLADVFQRLKQNDKAVEAYEKLLKIQPDNVFALNNLAWLYSLHNNPEALELAKKASKLKPEDSGIQDTYGWILVQQGRAEEGRYILERAIKALPDVAEVQYHYAVALLKTGEEARAREILARLLKDGKPFEGRAEAQKLLK